MAGERQFKPTAPDIQGVPANSIIRAIPFTFRVSRRTFGSRKLRAWPRCTPNIFVAIKLRYRGHRAVLFRAISIFNKDSDSRVRRTVSFLIL